jgi:hypothetical protein
MTDNGEGAPPLYLLFVVPYQLELPLKFSGQTKGEEGIFAKRYNVA